VAEPHVQPEAQPGLLEEEPLDAEALLAEVAGLDVKQLLMGAASTLATLALSKLDSGDLPQAKLAIDGVSALVPLLEGDLQRDLAQAVAGLQVAYADAVAAK
jgi:hypothetical protein